MGKLEWQTEIDFQGYIGCQIGIQCLSSTSIESLQKPYLSAHRSFSESRVPPSSQWKFNKITRRYESTESTRFTSINQTIPLQSTENSSCKVLQFFPEMQICLALFCFTIILILTLQAWFAIVKKWNRIVQSYRGVYLQSSSRLTPLLLQRTWQLFSSFSFQNWWCISEIWFEMIAWYLRLFSMSYYSMKFEF